MFLLNRVAILIIHYYLIDFFEFNKRKYFISDANRVKFKDFVNTLAHTKTDGDEKILILKSKYLRAIDSDPFSTEVSYSPQNDPRNSIGIPLSPSMSDFSPSLSSSAQSSPRPRQPPPYRPPPPVSSSTSSLDTISLGSLSSYNETPQAPPRRRESTRKKSAPDVSQPRPISTDLPHTPVKKTSISTDTPTTPVAQTSTPVDEITPVRQAAEADPNGEKKSISVKERTKEFNRLASVEDELSPRTPKSAEKEKSKSKSVSLPLSYLEVYCFLICLNNIFLLMLLSCKTVST